MLSNNENEVFTRAYQLKDIKKIAELPDGVLEGNPSLSDDNSATTYSVSDLYDFVKQYDKDFHPKSVTPLLLNEDGTPKKFYHGTNKDFTIFQTDGSTGRTDTSSNLGVFFLDNKEYAGIYASFGERLRGGQAKTYEVFLKANKVFDTREQSNRDLYEKSVLPMLKKQYATKDIVATLQDSSLPTAAISNEIVSILREILSIEDAPKNAQEIIDLHREVYNDNNREKQGTRESLHTSIERCRSLSNDLGDDMLDVEEQGAVRRGSELHRGESEGDGKRNPRKGDGNSDVRYSLKESRERILRHMAGVDRSSPYRQALIELILSINNEVPLKEEDQVLIVLKLDTEMKIVLFNNWIWSRLVDGELQATAPEITRAAVKIGKGQNVL